MARPVLAAALIIFHLLVASTEVNANCEACPNCDWENISPTQGNACLNYWTCSGDTITCYDPSVANPGTYTGCSYSASAVGSRFSLRCITLTTPGNFQSWALTAGPTNVCDSLAGVNSKCLPANNPYNLGIPACTASYGHDSTYFGWQFLPPFLLRSWAHRMTVKQACQRGVHAAWESGDLY
ncbi:hypothetical protein EDB19DRAFT_1832299 [Suillus lakei]|nr:hypothetical protein EDB19DRAFT_1832299 [Suillus lakei]